MIATHPDRGAWLADLLETIPTDRDVLIHGTGGYEIAALRTGCQAFDRFLLLQDSMRILDPTFWAVIDASGPAWLSGHPPMYLGIHDREQLEPVLSTYPATIDKETSITLEGDLPRHVTYDTIWPHITDRTALRTEHRHGRENLVLGNHLWEKWKGTWR